MLKAVFHKFDLVHSWIPWPKCHQRLFKCDWSFWYVKHLTVIKFPRRHKSSPHNISEASQCRSKHVEVEVNTWDKSINLKFEFFTEKGLGKNWSNNRKLILVNEVHDTDIFQQFDFTVYKWIQLKSQLIAYWLNISTPPLLMKISIKEVILLHQKLMMLLIFHQQSLMHNSWSALNIQMQCQVF